MGHKRSGVTAGVAFYSGVLRSISGVSVSLYTPSPTATGRSHLNRTTHGMLSRVLLPAPMTAHARCGCSHRKWEQPRAMVSVRCRVWACSRSWRQSGQFKPSSNGAFRSQRHRNFTSRFFLLHFACKPPFVCLLRGHVQVPESRTRNRGTRPSASVAARIHEAEISSPKFE